MIDLGPGDASKQLQPALVAGGFEPVIGDGVEDALAGRDADRDGVQLASALDTAQRAFGDLRCTDVVAAAKQAIGIAAARQAAGKPVPELARAWALVLLCADREGKLDDAQVAAIRLRALGGSTDVPAAVWAKYPDVDVIANTEQFDLDVDAEPGAAIWIDFQPVGTSPVHAVVTSGDHVIAAALGTRRGWAAGPAVRTQKAVHVPLVEAGGTWSDVAQRVASWKGQRPSPADLAWVLGKVHARLALIRHGDTVEAWGQIGRAEAPHLLGADDGTGTLAEVDRVVALMADRVNGWNDHAPDPDRPLLTEETAGHALMRRAGDVDKPTKWWVYAAIAGAAVIGGTIIFVHDSAGDRQRVELHYP